MVYSFQFTHPGRGATVLLIFCPCCSLGFNSRTPGGVRPHAVYLLYTHAQGFNSRTPGGVRLHHLSSVLYKRLVSIHAPREGCDLA
mgnify:CR=1 FL=1